jgi:hypothetical protein
MGEFMLSKSQWLCPVLDYPLHHLLKRRGYDWVMKHRNLVQVLLLSCLFMVALLAQVRPPQYPPPDIIPPEVLKTRDALQVDTQHNRLEFENEKMRVLRLTLKPSEIVPMHDDRDALVVCLKECHVRFMSPNGRSEDVHREPGTTKWIFGETRSEKNLGTKPVEMLFIETKSATAR